MSEKGRQQYEEYLKLLYDFAKHFTTLSTATALVIIGLFKDDFGFWLYIALVLLGVSVFFAVLIMGLVVLTMRTANTDIRPSKWLFLAKVMMVGTLLIALLLFGIHVFGGSTSYSL
jgi:hypothetical protein